MAQFWPPQPSDTGWQDITLSAGWSSLGSPNRGAIARARDGIVYVSIATSCSGAVSAGAIIGVLPVGCRPAAVVHATARYSPTGLVPLVVYPNGDVQTVAAVAAGVGVFGSFVFPLG